MSSYAESVRFLYGLQTRGMKFGLRGVQTLLDSIGNPQNAFPSVHIAGTNGKGSTAAMVAAILTAAGLKTGLYTSPHVVDFTERIRINGTPIAQRDVVSLLKKIQPFVRRNKVTFFETVTAMAFQHYAQKKVDIAVVETGLGGRLDATNVLHPLVSVITNIGLEHTDILGNSLSKIAYEKAGIIKPGVSCVTAVQSRVALDVIKRVARLRSSRLVRVKNNAKIVSSRITGTQFSVQGLQQLRLSLAGRHQVTNACLALSAVAEIRKKGFVIPVSAVRRGLADIQRYSGLSSRVSIIRRSPQVITDVAHNPDAIASLVRLFQDWQIDNLILVIGVSADKDFLRMISCLKPIVDRVIAVSAKTERARPAQDLVTAFVEQNIPVEAEESVAEGVQRAMNCAGPHQPILITGSHFVVGEALAFLQHKNYLTINQ